MGRRAQPIQIIKAKGKSHHISKAESDRRKKSEIKIDDKKLRIPDYVKNDVAAYSKWKELVSIYKNIDLVNAFDSGGVARYCKHYAEYLKLLEQKEFVENFEVNWDNYCMQVTAFVEDGVNKFLRMDPIMKLDSLINKKSDILTKLEDRLFLNPVSRLRNVAKKEKEEKDADAYMFGD